MDIKNKDEVLEFIKSNNPTIRGCSTMYSGFVTCIKPIKSICGAELMCNYDTIGALKKLLQAD